MLKSRLTIFHNPFTWKKWFDRVFFEYTALTLRLYKTTVVEREYTTQRSLPYHENKYHIAY